VQQELAAMFKAGRHAELESRANRLLELHPDSGFAWKVLGAALLVQGKEALQALQKAARLLPGDVETQNKLGNALKSAGRLEEAVACNGRALATRPDYAEAHNNLGTTQRALGQLDAAVASYRRALAIRPDYAEAFVSLGSALNLKTSVEPQRHRGHRGKTSASRVSCNHPWGDWYRIGKPLIL
jgi:tetratricopeptide (TPR) repeat protein